VRRPEYDTFESYWVSTGPRIQVCLWPGMEEWLTASVSSMLFTPEASTFCQVQGTYSTPAFLSYFEGLLARFVAYMCGEPKGTTLNPGGTPSLHRNPNASWERFSCHRHRWHVFLWNGGRIISYCRFRHPVWWNCGRRLRHAVRRTERTLVISKQV
jgi:hypothetical protein